MVRWHGEGDFIELKPVSIRGVESQGMICAANEIGLFDLFPHSEREILDVGEVVAKTKLKAGRVLAEVLDMTGDTVMDIEITTNHPDAMGMVGLAREAAAILKRPFLWKAAKMVKGKKMKGVSIRVDDKKLCPRFTAIKIDNVQVGASPFWLRQRLLSAGVRPINNIVDITNYVMLELGQPMHVYDAAKLGGSLLEVRRARAGEAMAALNGTEYELDDTMLVIADQDTPVAIAGVMGGERTGVALGTTSIVFEAATFDPVSVRRTARKLNLYSDAQVRFEKGLSTEALSGALARAVELCLQIAGGTVAGEMMDLKAAAYKAKTFSISFEEMTSLIGVALPKKDVTDTLHRLGFALKTTSAKISATVPWWRDHDIESGRDLVEEVARVYGYAHLPAIFPAGMPTRAQDQELLWEDRVRTMAKGAGLTEIYSYSFVSRDLLEKAGYDPAPMLRVQNPLSSDFEFMRTTLLPSMIQTVVDNQEQDRNVQLFEVAHAYYPRGERWDDLPDERLELSAGFLGGDEVWRRAKGFVEHLYVEAGISGIEWRRLTDDAFWHPGRTMQAFHGVHLLGTVGELHPTIADRFKIEGRLALVDVPLEEVIQVASSAKKYMPLPVYPDAKRDTAFVVTRDVEVQIVMQAMRGATSLLRHVEWFDTYTGKGVPADKKSIAFHLTFGVDDRTLEAKEVDEAMQQVEGMMNRKFGATVRS